jgi:hypothetical protein
MARQAHHPEPSRRVNLKFQYSMTKWNKKTSTIDRHIFLDLPFLMIISYMSLLVSIRFNGFMHVFSELAEFQIV